MIELPYGEETDNMLSRIHRIPERVGQTELLYQYRTSVCDKMKLQIVCHWSAACRALSLILFCILLYLSCLGDSSSSRMRVIYHNWSATKQRPHQQSVAEISHHPVLSGDRI